MARIIKIPSGKWQAHLCVNRVRKTKSFRTKVQAQEWVRDTEHKLSRGEVGNSYSHTLGDVLKRYQIEISEHKKGARWEVIRINKLLRDPLTDIKLIHLKREDIEDWVQRQLKSLKSSSVNRELNLLSHVFTQARRWRLMTGNPMADLQRPKAPPPRDRRISDEEIEKLFIVLNYCNGCSLTEPRQRVAIALLFAIETAMRAGEVCSLKASGISGKVAHLPETKNGMARDVPLSSRALEIINRLLPLKLSPLFGLTAGSLSSIFRKATIKASVQDLTFHDSRHEAITRLAGKLDVLDLARMVGHRDIRQLQTYYNKSAEDIAEQL